MRKKLLLINIILLAVIVVFLAFNFNQSTAILEVDGERGPVITVFADSGEKVIYPWHNEVTGRDYFFMPAYVKEDEELLSQAKQYDIEVMYSENIPAVFIDTASGSMNYLLENKENLESGSISIIEAEGNLSYDGELESISGRGNTSWEDYDKKPYSIRLTEPDTLLGMGAGRKWYLLPIWREGNKMNTKVAFDIAEALGMDFTPECTWVDLYLNGEYAGNYLLCEAISVGSGRVDIHDMEKDNIGLNENIEQAAAFAEADRKGYELENGDNISGGYLIEKDLMAYYEKEASGFILESGKPFTISEPGYASRQQVDYIGDFVQKLDTMIMSHNMEYLNYIDLDSFVKRFLVDEISLNCDANVTSMFFYKDQNNNRLYAGPVWDYDGAMGELNNGWMEGKGVDYRGSTLQYFRSEEDILGWYASLYQDEVFFDEMRNVYRAALPELKWILEKKIDNYAEQIRASVQMDEVRWQNVDTAGDYPGHYESFDNNVRYLKYYLANRLNFLNEQWDIFWKDFEVEENKAVHEVVFKNGEEIVEVRQVEDGACITDVPPLDEEIYWGWYYEHSGEKLRDVIPVYEDIVLFAREK